MRAPPFAPALLLAALLAPGAPAGAQEAQEGVEDAASSLCGLLPEGCVLLNLTGAERCFGAGEAQACETDVTTIALEEGAVVVRESRCVRGGALEACVPTGERELDLADALMALRPLLAPLLDLASLLAAAPPPVDPVGLLNATDLTNATGLGSLTLPTNGTNGSPPPG